MAEIPPTRPVRNNHVEAIIPDGCDGFGAEDIPNAADVARQARRINGMESNLLTNQNLVTDQEYGEALQIQHMILSKSVGLGGAPGWAVDFFNRINIRFDGIDRRFDRMDDQLRLTNTSILAGHSRAYNSNTYNANLPYRSIVKYYVGHPDPEPPVAIFRFDQIYYPVGTLPPDGLVPTTKEEVRAISMHGRIDAIYWFYNDPRLAPYEGHNLTDRRLVLENFLMFF